MVCSRPRIRLEIGLARNDTCVASLSPSNNNIVILDPKSITLGFGGVVFLRHLSCVRQRKEALRSL